MVKTIVRHALAQAEMEMENAVARAVEVGMPVEAVTLRDRVGGQG